MERPRLPLDQVLSVMGLTARFVGDDPDAPSHLRLGMAERAVLWPIPSLHGEVFDEALGAVADMVANGSQLDRSNRDLVVWARMHGLDPRAPRTQSAFDLALVLD